MIDPRKLAWTEVGIKLRHAVSRGYFGHTQGHSVLAAVERAAESYFEQHFHANGNAEAARDQTIASLPSFIEAQRRYMKNLPD